MRILVLSDTHGNKDAIDRALAQAGDFDRVFHLGDNYRDAEYISCITAKPIDKVPGNCDFIDEKQSIVVDIKKKRFFLTHGHNYGVGYSLTRIMYAAEEKGADVLLFGHTHRSMIDYEGKLMIVNPGSISKPRGCPASFAVINIDDNGVVRSDICRLV